MKTHKFLKIFYYFILSVNSGIFLSYIILGINAGRKNLFIQADLTAHYTAWKIIQDGYKTQLYNLDLQRQYQQRILVDRAFSEGLLMYNYPPYTALFLSFLGHFSLIDAFYIWFIFQFAFLIFLILSIGKILKPLSYNERNLIYAAILAFPPLFFNFMLGAFSLLVSLGTLKIYENLKSKREIKAGLWWLPLLLKPQFGLFPGLMILIAKRWKALLIMIFSCGLVGFFTSLELGVKIWEDYFRVLIKSSAQFGTHGIDPRDMYNLKAILTLIFNQGQGNLINLISWMVFTLATFSIILIGLKGPNDLNGPIFDLRYSLTLTVFIFTFPHVNAHDGLLLIPAVVLFYKYLVSKNKSVIPFSIFAFSLPTLFLVSKFAEQIRINHWIPPVLILCFLFWQIYYWVNETKTPQQGKKTVDTQII